jgi:hypothetical protein
MAGPLVYEDGLFELIIDPSSLMKPGIEGRGLCVWEYCLKSPKAGEEMVKTFLISVTASGFSSRKRG